MGYLFFFYYFISFFLRNIVKTEKLFFKYFFESQRLHFFSLKILNWRVPRNLQLMADFVPLQSVHSINEAFWTWKGFSWGFHLRDVEESRSPKLGGRYRLKGASPACAVTSAASCCASCITDLPQLLTNWHSQGSLLNTGSCCTYGLPPPIPQSTDSWRPSPSLFYYFLFPS